ncbi:MAG: type VI secretion system baseplate subunit TssG [Planctomycetaceae bacterium]|jgi:type VI secretion system protein ImpH|nr:type VI secretion system baseplate subunit TssG [Planctomycetaceae bacterium]
MREPIPLTLIEHFRKEPYRFDFWQSVKLLQNQTLPDNVSPDKTLSVETLPEIAAVSPDKERFRFASHISQHFPASDVQNFIENNFVEGDIEGDKNGINENEYDNKIGKPVLSVNFLGLAGLHGPLPVPVTELILDRVKQGDTGLRDFLDIFNHRLISLFYRAMEPMRPGCGSQTHPAETEFADYLYAIAGLLTNGLRKPEHARFLPHAILFANRRKTASGLEKIISERFGVTAKVEEFQGRWLWVEERDRTKLGRANHQLSQNAMLGGRFWNQSAGFVLRVKTLHTNKKRNEILNIFRFYVGDGLHCELQWETGKVQTKFGETRLNLK